MSDTNGNQNNTLLLDNDENSDFKEGSIDSENKKNTVNNLLHISEDDENFLPEVEDAREDTALVETKHSLINSPWSRFGVVGGGAAIIFFLIYLFLGPIMNGSFAKKEEPKSAKIVTTVEETKESKKDGDVYAKLALQRQADELAKLNGQKTSEPPKPITTQTQKDLPEKPRIIQAKPVQQATTTSSPPPRVIIQRSLNPSPIPVTAKREVSGREYSLPGASRETSLPEDSGRLTSPQLALRQTETITKPTDPMAELERLRSIGSAGRINYIASVNTSSTENKGSSNNTDDTDYIPRRRSSDTRSLADHHNSKTTGAAQPDIGAIEQLKPRWTPNTVRLRNLSVEAGRGAEGQRGRGAEEQILPSPLRPCSSAPLLPLLLLTPLLLVLGRAVITHQKKQELLRGSRSNT